MCFKTNAKKFYFCIYNTFETGVTSHVRLLQVGQINAVNFYSGYD